MLHGADAIVVPTPWRRGQPTDNNAPSPELEACALEGLSAIAASAEVRTTITLMMLWKARKWLGRREKPELRHFASNLRIWLSCGGMLQVSLVFLYVHARCHFFSLTHYLSCGNCKRKPHSLSEWPFCLSSCPFSPWTLALKTLPPHLPRPH